MRIKCTYCGERDSSEFVFLGAAQPQRPSPDEADAARKFYEFVYVRENPRGPHEEYWYHVYGCRAWLRVTRDTLTHEVLAVAAAADRAR